ncbi:MAG: GAF domain-containing protein [Nitrospirae bacterium]|nr:GAF domain-containing protein [Nitrospirota bacterium]
MAAAIIIGSWLWLLKSLRDSNAKREWAETALMDSEEKSHLIENQTRLAEIGKALQTCKAYADFGNTLTSELGTAMGLAYGAFYVSDKAHTSLQRFGGYACEDIGNGPIFAWGQGLVGQAALDRQPISLELPTSGSIAAIIGIGSIAIRYVYLVPVVHRGEVLAVIELGSLGTFDEKQKAFLDALLPVVAMNMEILSANIETRELLTGSRPCHIGISAKGAR